MSAVPRFGEIAAQLAANGYAPIPLAPDSKIPTVTGWPDYRFNPLDSFARGGRFAGKRYFPNYATGIITGDVVGIDCDVLDEALSRKVRSLIRRRLGPAPLRVGRAPKFMLIYRTANAFAKMQTRHFAVPGDAQTHAVEILGARCQFAAYGIHAKTGKPYTWTPRGLLDIPKRELTGITEQQARDLLDEIERVAFAAGFRPVGPATRPRRTSTTAPRDVVKLPRGEAQRRVRDFEAMVATLIAAGLVGRTRDPWIEITCPWCAEHTDGAIGGSALRVPAAENSWLGGFRCHHAHCEHRTVGDVYRYTHALAQRCAA